MPSLTCHCFGYNFTVPHIHESQNLKKYFGGDIQKFTSKLPSFIWAKYKGEKHLPSYLLFNNKRTIHIDYKDLENLFNRICSEKRQNHVNMIFAIFIILNFSFKK